MSSATPFRIALLVNDTPVKPVIDAFGEYPEIYERWLAESKPPGETTLQMTAFDVVNNPGTYPNPEEYDGIILTGSAASAYSPLPWIEQLKEYVASVAKDHPRVKLIGICFGHQIIASALGGTCVPNDGNWEIGVTEILLTPTGKEVFGVDTLTIQQFHRDHVPELPPGFQLLGSTTVSPIQGMIRPYPAITEGVTPSSHDTHILTIQGHPEFTAGIVERIVNVREERGILSEARAAQAREDGQKRHDGTGVVARAIWRVLLSPAP
ncbi:hypothetical protein FRC17_000528 [Serendipita sp. 399]|nr:hypothetical protein FRC17_000528 [Serendipita sp. 399]